MATTHGMSYTKLYGVWTSMLVRCEYPNHPTYRRYGARGIKVCERWKSFENFHADMGDRPDGATLDRINNDGNYEPSNCRWATRKQQQNNRGANKLLTLNSATMTMQQWADSLGINKSVLSLRLRRYGWTVERTLTTPVRPKGPNGDGRQKRFG